MKVLAITATLIAGLAAFGLTPSGHSPAMAQVDRSTAQERACEAKYEDIFSNLNSTSPNKRRVSDEEISWAFDYEKVKREGRPCSDIGKAEQASAKAAAKPAVKVEAGGGTNALAGQAAYNSGDFATARAKYQIGCFTEGNGAACTNLGVMASSGEGGASDLPLARRAYQQGCAKDVGEACENYGSMLINGRGGAKDYAGAIAPLSTACNASFATSCYDLGATYYFGHVGSAPDYTKARQYFAKACPDYAADGCYALAILQRDGGGGPVDAAGAAQSFKLSCEAGNSDGCLEYGVAQYDGAGIAQDMAGARSSFGQACNTGNAGACMNAGIMARDGQGGPVDPAAAKRMFGLGCKLGIQDGCSLAQSITG